MSTQRTTFPDAQGALSLRDGESMGPQEWRWHLEERQFVSSSGTELIAAGLLDARVSVVAAAADSFLPANATVRTPHYWDLVEKQSQEETAADGLGLEDCRQENQHVTHALQWLHKAVSIDAPKLQSEIKARRGAIQRRQSRRSLLEERSDKLQRDWNSLCSTLGMPVGSLESTEKEAVSETTQLFSTWRLEVLQPECQKQLQQIISTHKELLKEVEVFYKEACERLEQPPLSTQQVSLQNNLDNLCTEVVPALQERLAFVRGRRLEHGSNKTLPPFLTWIAASEDAGALERYERQLEQLVQALSSHELVVWGTLSQPGAEERIVSSMQKIHDHWKECRRQCEQARNDLSREKSELMVLEKDAVWTGERIESLKRHLEDEISALIADKNQDQNEPCSISIDCS